MRALSRTSDIPLSNHGAVLFRTLIVVALLLAVVIPLAG